MADPVLEISDLSVHFDTPAGEVAAVNGVSLAIGRDESLGIAGESAAGKSLIFRAAFGLAPEGAWVSGSVKFSGQRMLGLSRPELDNIRGRYAAFLFGDAANALSPHLTVAAQMVETLTHHFQISDEDALKRAGEWLERVGIADAEALLAQYPHQLSPFTRQLVMLALAMMGEPALLIADEPTAALGPFAQTHLLDLIAQLAKQAHTSVAFISRDLGAIAHMSQRVVVVRRGEVVESGAVGEIFAAPKSEYARALLQAAPRIAGARAFALAAPTEGPALLEVEDLRVHFQVEAKTLRAVDGVNFTLRAGETLAVVGEAGCGKSTLARAVLQLQPRTAGAVHLLGRALVPSDRALIARSRREMQAVFAEASLDPRLTLAASIGEPLLAFAPELSVGEHQERVTQIMLRVGLDPDLGDRRPHEASNADLQRAALARAMIGKPKLVVCDEPAAALDLTEQARLLALLADLQREDGVSLLYISRDLAVARAIAHRLLVLFFGQAVECGPTEAVLAAPRHPYTRALVAATLAPDPSAPRLQARVEAEWPSPLDTRAPLRFLGSKRLDHPDAVQYRPHWIEAAPGHFVAEHDGEEGA
jgi:ABC-type microcin C transport system duplicated ATPase subunit YejF